MIYEIRYQYRFFSDAWFAQMAPCLVQPWQTFKVRRTRYWWRARLAAWIGNIVPSWMAVSGGMYRVRVRVMNERP